jgi:hypothetical protein
MIDLSSSHFPAARIAKKSALENSTRLLYTRVRQSIDVAHATCGLRLRVPYPCPSVRFRGNESASSAKSADNLLYLRGVPPVPALSKTNSQCEKNKISCCVFNNPFMRKHPPYTPTSSTPRIYSRLNAQSPISPPATSHHPSATSQKPPARSESRAKQASGQPIDRSSRGVS